MHRIAARSLRRARGLSVLALAAAATAAWTQTLSWSVPPLGVWIAADAAENVYTADWDANLGGDITLTKTGPSGHTVWTARFDNTDGTRSEAATGVAVDSTGGAYVSGTSRSGFSNPVNANALLMRFAADGTLRWRRLVGANFDGGSSLRVLVDEADAAYVVGQGPTPAGVRARVHKFDAAGNLVWTWFDATGVGAPVNAKWGADGAIVIATRSVTGTLGGVAKVGRDGQALLTVGGVPAFATVDAAGDAAGNVYVASLDPASQQGRLQKIAAPSGTPLWTRSDGVAFSRVEVAPDGGAVASGFPGGNSFGVAFVRYAADGSLAWANRDADGPSNMLFAHGPMRLDAAGNAYITASNGSQIGVTRVNADGSTGWTVLAPFGYGLALDFGRTSNAVYTVGGQTVRIDQGGTPPPPPPADLAVSLSDAPDPVRPGADLVLTTVVRNVGGSSAAAVALNQNLSAAVTPVSASTTQGSCSGARPLVCSLGSIAPGGAVTVVQVVRPRSAGTLVTTANATTTSADAVPGNNGAQATTTVRRR